MPGTDSDRYGGAWLTPEERKQFLRDLDATPIPLCEEHGGLERQEPGRKLPAELQIGSVEGGYLDKSGNLNVLGVVKGNNDFGRKLVSDLLNDRYWGLSAFTDVSIVLDGEGRAAISKKISHAGITRTPLLKDEGSHIFEYGPFEGPICNRLKKKAESGDVSFATDRFAERCGLKISGLHRAAGAGGGGRERKGRIFRFFFN